MTTPADPHSAEPVAWRWRANFCPWHLAVSEHETRGAYEVEGLYPESALLAERQAREAAELELDRFKDAAKDTISTIQSAVDDSEHLRMAAEASLAKARARIAEIEAALESHICK